MTEQYGFQFKVDATDAAKGWKQFESAVEGVFKALDRMESHVEKTMTSVNNASKKSASGLAAFKKAANDLGNLKVGGSSTKNITALNNAMKSFKAPSAAQVKNLNDFFKALNRAGTGGGAAAARNIEALKNAVNGFKSPSASNVRNISDFFAALSTFRNNGLANAAGMFSSLRQISGFKAPSATQVKNLQAFLTTVANLRIPQNGAQIASVLDKIARASSAANQNLRGVRGVIGGFNWSKFNAGSRQATVNMMGLQNAFSATYQMGSVLRTLFGSLTVAELGRNFFEATNRLQSFNASMTVISREAGFANDQLQFVTDTAYRLGLAYGPAAEAFAKFSISASKAGATTAQARDIFEGFGTAMTVMGLSADRQTDVMLALQQSMNKGYLSSEELNQQLNEHLPGALGYLREELKKTGIELEDALKKKAIDATQGLLFLASKYREEFGPALEQALNRPAAQMNILRTNITKMFESIAANGGNEGFTDFLKRINAYMRPEDIERYGKAIGELIRNGMNKLSNAVDWLAQNWDSLKGPLATGLKLIGTLAVVSGTLQIGRFLVTPILSATSAFRTFIPVASQGILLMRAMNASSLAGLLTSVRQMDPATLALLQRFNGLKTTLSTMPPNPFGAIRAGATQLTGIIPNIVSSFAKMGGAIAAGLTLAMAVGREENEKYAHDSYSTTEIVSGFFLTLGDNISSVWTTVSDFMAEKFGWVAETISTIVNGLWGTIKEFFMALAFGFTKVAEAIWKTMTGVFKGIANQISLIGSAIGKLLSGDFAGAGSAALGFVTGQGFASGFQDSFKGFLADIPGQFRQYKADVHAGYGVVSNQLAAYGERGRGAADRGRALDQTAQENLNSLYDPTKLLRTDQTEDGKKKGGGRKKRTPKPVDPMKELDRIQRKVDDVMKRLAEDNPLLKLQQDFINDLTEQAQTLLTDGGYQKWMKELADSGGDASVAMEALKDQLTGAGADQKVLTDLQTRYGKSVNDLTEYLERQGRAYAYKTAQAKIDAEFGGRIIKDMNDQVHLARMSTVENRTLAAVMEEVRKINERGGEIDQERIDKLADQIRLRERYLDLLKQEREFYENNGVNSYINSIKTVGETVHELDKTFLGGLEDTIFRIGKEGKLSFTSLFDSIQDGLLRFASQNITKAIAGFLTGDKDSKNPTIFGGLFKAFGLDIGFDKEAAAQRFNAQNVDLYSGTVNVNGQLMSGPLGSSFNAGTAMGGLDANGDIVVNAGWVDDIESQMTTALGRSAEDTAKLMNQSWGQSINGLGGQLNYIIQSISGGGGGGGIAGLATKLIGGVLGVGGLFPGVSAAAVTRLTPDVMSNIAANPGIFKEGGYSTSPVVRWNNAPHYSEGTHNTTPGIPAVLHDNEAVIPLSRGRKVPVTLTNERGSGSPTVVNNVWNVQTPNADSFKRSQQQMSNQMHRAATRAVQRNN